LNVSLILKILTMEVSRQKGGGMKISNQSLAIGIPCDFPFIPSSFFYSFVLMDKPNFIFIHADNGPIDTLRNDLVEKALAEGCTHILMCDVDQIYPVDTIKKLLSHKVPVVAGSVPRRYPPFDPIMLRNIDGVPTPMNVGDYEDGALVPVDATGTGCIMYNLEVFRKLPYPWFKFRKQADGRTLGEDIGLCMDLKKAGYSIYVDTSVKIGHLTTMVVTEATHKLWCGMQLAKEKKVKALGVME